MDLLTLPAALEKPVTFFLPPFFTGSEEEDVTPDERELIHFYHEIEHRPLQLIALKQVRTLAESAIEADMETKRRELEQHRLENSE